MTGMRIVGVLLIAVGLAALAYRGFSFTSREKVVDLGPVEVTRDKSHYLPLPPILGGAAIAIGVGLLIGSARQVR
jgi:hypothetical protein